MNYKIVPNIILRNTRGALTADASLNLTQISLRQGDLDGACAVYCVVMCLLRLQYLSKEDISLFVSPDRRTAKGKLLFELFENNGLVRNGTSFIVLRRELESKLGDGFSVDRYEPTEYEDKVQKIVDLIDDDIAPIISVQWKNREEGGHTLFAIGYEYDETNIVTKILCLDPSSTNVKVAPWNCYIDVRKSSSEFPHKVVSAEYNSPAVLTDIIAIRKND